MALGRKSRRGVEFFPGFSDIVEIGMGSLSTVYQAREAGTNRRVALKLLNVRDAEPRAVESFEREAVALAELSSHPNIVTLYRMFTAPDGRPVLVLELCRGSMGERMINATAVPVPEAVAIGIKIAGALETAHRAQILHRDVKPQNILVTEFGEPALADFGVAMLQSSTQTTAGLFDFTTLHAAPELLEGGSTSAATDVYELASTLYQMIAGQSAFRAYDGESPASVILRILRDPVRPLVAQDVPPPLSDLLIWAMSKDRESRPPTAAEFATGLAEVEIAQGWPRTQFLIRDSAAVGSSPSITRMPDQMPRAERGRLQPPVALPPPVTAPGPQPLAPVAGLPFPPGAQPVVPSITTGGPTSNGTSPHGAPANGSDTYGPAANGQVANGPVANGPVANGPVANGPVANGAVAPVVPAPSSAPAPPAAPDAPRAAPVPEVDPFGPVSYSQHQTSLVVPVIPPTRSTEPDQSAAAEDDVRRPAEAGSPTGAPPAPSAPAGGGSHRRGPDTDAPDPVAARAADDQPAPAPTTHVRSARLPAPVPTPAPAPLPDSGSDSGSDSDATGRHGEPAESDGPREPSAPAVPQSGLIDSLPDFLAPVPRTERLPSAPGSAPAPSASNEVSAPVQPAAPVQPPAQPVPDTPVDGPVLPSAPPDQSPVPVGPPLDATLPPGSLPAPPADERPVPPAPAASSTVAPVDDFSAPRTFGHEGRNAPPSPPAPWRPPTPAPGDLLRPATGPRPGTVPVPEPTQTPAPAVGAAPEPVAPTRPEEPATTVRKLPPLPTTGTPDDVERTHRRSELPAVPPPSAPPSSEPTEPTAPPAPAVPVDDPYATTFRSGLSHQVPGSFVTQGEPPPPMDPSVAPPGYPGVPPVPGPPVPGPPAGAPPAPLPGPPDDRSGAPSWWADVNAAPEHTYTGPRPPLPQPGARPGSGAPSEPGSPTQQAQPAPTGPPGAGAPPGPPSESAPARPETAAVPMWALRQAAAQISAGGQFADLGIDPYSLQSKLTVRSGLASVTIDDNGIRARRGLSRVHVAWLDIHGFEPRGQAESAVLGAVTGNGWIELSGTKRPMAELQHVHALFDAYRARALGTGR